MPNLTVGDLPLSRLPVFVHELHEVRGACLSFDRKPMYVYVPRWATLGLFTASNLTLSNLANLDNREDNAFTGVPLEYFGVYAGWPVGDAAKIEVVCSQRRGLATVTFVSGRLDELAKNVRELILRYCHGITVSS